MNEITSFQDLIKILRTNPEYLEELRRLILTEELLNLPKRFDDFLKNEFEPLKQDVEVLKQDVKVLKKDVAKLKNDVNSLKGSDFERKVREKAPAYFGKIIRKCKVISFEELAFLVEDKLDEGVITEEEKTEVLLLDVVVTGYLKHNREQKIMIGAEVSLTIDIEDLHRSKRRAEILAKVYGTTSFPVVIGEYDFSLEEKAQELGVIIA